MPETLRAASASRIELIAVDRRRPSRFWLILALKLHAARSFGLSESLATPARPVVALVASLEASGRETCATEISIGAATGKNKEMQGKDSENGECCQ